MLSAGAYPKKHISFRYSFSTECFASAPMSAMVRLVAPWCVTGLVASNGTQVRRSWPFVL